MDNRIVFLSPLDQVQRDLDTELRNLNSIVESFVHTSNKFFEKRANIGLLRQELENARFLNATCNGGQHVEPDSDISSLVTEIQDQINLGMAEGIEMVRHILQCKTHIRYSATFVLEKLGQLKQQFGVELSAALQKAKRSNATQITLDATIFQAKAEYLADVAWKLRVNLKTSSVVCQRHTAIMGHPNNGQVVVNCLEIPELTVVVTQVIHELVQDTFLVVGEPCQVVKLTNCGKCYSIFGTKVSLLVGAKLGLQQCPPPVSVCLLDEKACLDIYTNGLTKETFKTVTERQQGKMLPESTPLEICHYTNCSTANLQHLTLHDYSRGKENGKTEKFAEDKLALLFRLQFQAGDMEFQILKFSLPVVISSHWSQDDLAWATVTWDNTLSETSRLPFHIPNHANLDAVMDMLNGRWSAIVGSSLSKLNLEYFEERLCSFPGYPDKLSWASICKTRLPGTKFTLWEWFYEAAKFIERHLKEAWKDGNIMGFSGKDQSVQLLESSGLDPGTFLVRFSESMVGGISIIFIHSDGNVYKEEPFEWNKRMSAADLLAIFAKVHMQYVYPDIRKEEAFQALYEQASKCKTRGRTCLVGYHKRTDIPKFDLKRASAIGATSSGTSGNNNGTPKQQPCASTASSPIYPPVDPLGQFVMNEIMADPLDHCDYYDPLARAGIYPGETNAAVLNPAFAGMETEDGEGSSQQIQC